MPYNFDHIIDRRHSDSEKWRAFDADVLPLWVADMDFTAPEPVIRALHERVEHGIFGYGGEPPELREILVRASGAVCLVGAARGDRLCAKSRRGAERGHQGRSAARGWGAGAGAGLPAHHRRPGGAGQVLQAMA